jgi:hypothetical protein
MSKSKKYVGRFVEIYPAETEFPKPHQPQPDPQGTPQWYQEATDQPYTVTEGGMSLQYSISVPGFSLSLSQVDPKVCFTAVTFIC